MQHVLKPTVIDLKHHKTRHITAKCDKNAEISRILHDKILLSQCYTLEVY